MKIINKTKKCILNGKAKLCQNDLCKFLGLMLSKKQDNALIFVFSREKKISLHMLFVFYPIDALFLNKEKTVVDIKEEFKPFTLYKSKKKAMYVVEMPANAIKKTKTELGDKIFFENF